MVWDCNSPSRTLFDVIKTYSQGEPFYNALIVQLQNSTLTRARTGFRSAGYKLVRHV